MAVIIPFKNGCRFNPHTVHNPSCDILEGHIDEDKFITYGIYVEDYEKAVTAGADVAGPLEASGVFRPMVVQMLAVGQQSGQLESMLERLAEAYDREVDTAAQRLTAMLEPLLIVLLAILVGFIAFATILPILEMSDVL